MEMVMPRRRADPFDTDDSLYAGRNGGSGYSGRARGGGFGLGGFKWEGGGPGLGGAESARPGRRREDFGDRDFGIPDAGEPARRRPSFGGFGSGGAGSPMLWLVAALGLFAVIAIASIADRNGGQQPQQAGGFDLSDFHWSWLIERLVTGDTESIMHQSADHKFLLVWYIGAMVDELSKTYEMGIWKDPRCYMDIYNPETKTRIYSVGLANVGPTIVGELFGGLGSSGGRTLAQRFPYASDLFSDIWAEWSRGSPHTMMGLMDLRRMTRERAKKDTYRLVHQYGCEPDGYTAAVFHNMHLLLERYSDLGYAGR
jgi:hypothetical protein